MDKSLIYDCISTIVTKLFTEFCNAVASKPKTKERDQNLETIAIILLIEFNNPNKNIRKHADKFLSCLVDKFPHLLWSKAVLFGMLNALQTLSLYVMDEDTQGKIVWISSIMSIFVYSVSFIDFADIVVFLSILSIFDDFFNICRFLSFPVIFGYFIGFLTIFDDFVDFVDFLRFID